MEFRCWSPTETEKAILEMTRGKRYRSPISDFPKVIGLPTYIHDRLNSMREATYFDDKERWSAVGFRGARTKLHPFGIAAAEDEGQVTDVSIESLLQRATKHRGIRGPAVELFAHPEYVYEETRRLHADDPGVEIPDFYFSDLLVVLHPAVSAFVVGVVTQSANTFAFATKESGRELPREVWAGGDPTRNWHRFIETNRSGSQGLNTNQLLASTFRLALYKGFKDTALIRIYPKRS